MILRLDARASKGSWSSSAISLTRILDRRPLDHFNMVPPVGRQVGHAQPLRGRLDDFQAVVLGRHLAVPNPHDVAAGVDCAGEVEAHSADIIPRMQRARAACSVWFSVGTPASSR